MNVDRYESPLITANSAITFINPLPIENSCRNLKEELQSLVHIKDYLLEAKSYASSDNFYMEGINMEERLEQNSIDIEKMIQFLEDYIEYVEKALYRAIDSKQIELNEEAKKQEKLLVAQGGTTL